MVGDATHSWCIMRKCGLAPLQFKCFHAAMRLYISLTQSNSSIASKISKVDMQLSLQCDNCWSSHILPAMDGLIQSYMFNEMLLKCEPIDCSRFAVDLSVRHLKYWASFPDAHPREGNNKSSSYQ